MMFVRNAACYVATKVSLVVLTRVIEEPLFSKRPCVL